MRIGILTLTQGNINNDHLYLTEILEMFPKDSIGGESEEKQAPVLVEIHSGVGAVVLTDIAGDKKIFRRRAWVREFFKTHHLGIGDKVAVERTGPARLH